MNQKVYNLNENNFCRLYSRIENHPKYKLSKENNLKNSRTFYDLLNDVNIVFEWGNTLKLKIVPYVWGPKRDSSDKAITEAITSAKNELEDLSSIVNSSSDTL